MTNFNSVFGSSPVQVADVGYRAVALAVSTALVWPFQSVTIGDSVARVMDVTPSGAGLAITLPDATQVSAGYDMLMSNKGAFTFTLLAKDGVTVLATLAPGASKYLYLTDSTTSNGTWGILLFGAVASSLDAGALAGFGLVAIGATLAQSTPLTSFNANYTIVASDRGKIYVWTGGTGTLTLPLTSTSGIGSDFAFELRNGGTGVLTVACSGSDNVDGSATIALQPTESLRLHANGSALWYSVGRGRSTQFNFTLLIKAVTGGSVTLTSTEAANVVQRYTGTLVSNQVVVLPSVVQVYYISNQTSGAFSLTFNCGAGTTVSIPSGQSAILFCDGTNTINTSTTVSGISSLTLAAGTVSAPSINYSGDTSTGFYQPTTGSSAFSSGGTQRVLFNSTGLTVTGALAVTAGGGFGAVVTGITPTLAAHLATKGYVDSVVGGGGSLPLTGGSGSPMTGTIYSSAAEAMRVVNSSGFVSFYNTAGSTRTGYLIGTSGTALQIVAENGAAAQLASAGASLSLTAAGSADLTGTQLTVTTSGSSRSIWITDTGVNGANIKLSGSTGGGTPSKTIRASGGLFQITNDAYSQSILSLTDAGALTILAGLTVGGGVSGVTNIDGVAGDTGAYNIAGGPNHATAGMVQVYGGSASSTPGYVYIVTSNVARMSMDASGNAAFLGGGKVKFTSANTGSASDVASVYSDMTASSLRFVDSTQATNGKVIEFLSSGGAILCRFVSDNYAASANWAAAVGTSAGITRISLYSGTSEAIRIAGGFVNISASNTTAQYQLQVQGAGQQTAALTDAGAKGGSLYLRDTASGGTGQGGALLFGGFDVATPFAAIKGYITNASNNSLGDLAIATRNAATDVALTDRWHFAAAGDLIPQSTYNIGSSGSRVGTVFTTNFNNSGTLTLGGLFTASAGISFGGTTLGNYVESAIGLAVGGSGGGSLTGSTTSTSKYTRVGNCIFLQYTTSWTSSTCTGNVQITGLPVAANGACYMTATASQGSPPHFALVVNGSTTILMETANLGALTWTQMGAGTGYITVFGFYFV